MRAIHWIIVIGLAALTLGATNAAAHESYEVGDYTITVGDQNEPIYTYKWTNLDLIVRDGDGLVALSEDELADLDTQLEAPGGEMLNGTLEGQYGEEGRYEFGDGHYYTQPGQYTLHLDGQIRGTDVTGTYDLPGPRQSFSDHGFPHDDVPTPIQLQSTVEQLQQTEDENEQLQERIDELETRIDELEQEQTTLSDQQRQIRDEANNVPGFSLAAGLAALAGVALLATRRTG